MNGKDKAGKGSPERVSKQREIDPSTQEAVEDMKDNFGCVITGRWYSFGEPRPVSYRQRGARAFQIIGSRVQDRAWWDGRAGRMQGLVPSLGETGLDED